MATAASRWAEAAVVVVVVVVVAAVVGSLPCRPS
jgi:hypothetical protein